MGGGNNLELVGLLTNLSLIAIICFVAGFALVVVEMFHPGFGAPGIMGGILLVLGVIMTAQSILQAFILLLIIMAILGAALALVLQSAAKGRLNRILILHEAQKKEDGYIGTEDLNYFLGQIGNTVTILRPAGTADFSGIKLDVVSEGEFIPRDTKVKIIKVQGRRIVVKECK